jgi:hypothetical protein
METGAGINLRGLQQNGFSDLYIFVPVQCCGEQTSA